MVDRLIIISPDTRRVLSAKTVCVHAQARVDDEASQLFLHDLLQDVTVQREIRDQVLEFRVLLAQLPELAQLAQAQPRILLLPNNGMDGAPSPIARMANKL